MRKGDNLIKKVAILGLGLMGGSLAAALKKVKSTINVVGYARRLETRKKAIKMGIVDEVFDKAEEAAKGADVVVVCVPVMAIPSLINSIKNSVGEKTVITDVGSTKKWLIAETRKLVPHLKDRIVGSHPIAGSEQTGIESAKANLYEGAVVVITKDTIVSPFALKQVSSLWEMVGAKVKFLGPGEHDKIIGLTSHLPHIVSSLLADVIFNDKNLLKDKIKNISLFCGKGVRDTTRIAAGDVEMWHDIIKTNRMNILFSIERFMNALAIMRTAIKKDDALLIKKILDRGRKGRKKIGKD